MSNPVSIAPKSLVQLQANQACKRPAPQAFPEAPKRSKPMFSPRGRLLNDLSTAIVTGEITPHQSASLAKKTTSVLDQTNHILEATNKPDKKSSCVSQLLFAPDNDLKRKILKLNRSLKELSQTAELVIKPYAANSAQENVRKNLFPTGAFMPALAERRQYTAVNYHMTALRDKVQPVQDAITCMPTCALQQPANATPKPPARQIFLNNLSAAVAAGKINSTQTEKLLAQTTTALQKNAEIAQHTSCLQKTLRAINEEVAPLMSPYAPGSIAENIRKELIPPKATTKNLKTYLTDLQKALPAQPAA